MNFRCQTIYARSCYHTETFSPSCSTDQSPSFSRPASSVGSSSERAICHASCVHGHHTTSVIRRRAFIGWILPQRGPFHPGTVRCRSLVERITECCVKSWLVARVASFLRSARGLPCRSRASPPAELRTTLRPGWHRDRASPHASSCHAPRRASRHHVPQSLHTMTPPSTNFAGTGERIG